MLDVAAGVLLAGIILWAYWQGATLIMEAAQERIRKANEGSRDLKPWPRYDLLGWFLIAAAFAATIALFGSRVPWGALSGIVHQ